MADRTAPPRRRRGRIVYWVIFIVAAACLVAAVSWERATGDRAYRDPAPEMEHAIQPGDRLIAVPGLAVRRGDVVILRAPPASRAPAGVVFVRRVIGLPGDRVACCDASGHITVDGRPLDESYVYPGDPPSDTGFSVTLRRGQLWVLADHRSIAIDSRMWGPVPAADVTGRVTAILHGASLHALRTPQAFIADGLAPPDERGDSGLIWPLAMSILATTVLLVLIVLGIIRMLIRRRRRRRSLRASTSQ